VFHGTMHKCMDMSGKVTKNSLLRAAALAAMPMALGMAGALLDERLHLGFSTWRTACRAAGLTLLSLLTFTIQLLPTAVLGVLAGGLAIQGLGLLARHRPGATRVALAAHGGCAVAMSVGLVLCTFALPLPVLLGAELLLAAAAAWILLALLERTRQVRIRADVDLLPHIRESAT
jgi:hypothetical protein